MEFVNRALVCMVLIFAMLTRLLVAFYLQIKIRPED